jgi:hypothetical protein
MNRPTISSKEVNSEDTTHDNVDRSAISDTSRRCSETPERVFGFTGIRTFPNNNKVQVLSEQFRSRSCA